MGPGTAPTVFWKNAIRLCSSSVAQIAAPPTTSEQLEAFGRPGNQFQKSPMDPNWTPKNAYDRDVDVLASSRSKWAESPMDNEWVPESGFRHSDPTNNFNQSKWAQSPMDNEWVPQDGFKNNKS